ncbi:hypothetical protein JMUB7504_27720 [Staphylococcus aureus]
MNKVVTIGLIYVAISIIDPMIIALNFFFGHRYDCQVVLVTISCCNVITYVNYVIIGLIPK